ncbi:MAG: RagB/SusD family nutrient uptake outer membrane protein [Pseudobacter sp.]|uniref:RagB/SusD family nutrient uptake outer membrane protein n=1 Tax=Pseudobacter sp. TaxID=2045420 RepID=UPI003F81E20D
MSFIETAADLNEVLIGDAYIGIGTSDIQTNLFHISDDDIDVGIPTVNYQLFFEHGIQYWQDEPRINSAGEVSRTDSYYNTVYAKIARINTIIFEADRLLTKGEPVAVINRIRGEAHFLRALYYYTLVNLYGKPYRPSTAQADPGVPLKISPDITSQFVSRSSVKDVYDQIIRDLEIADTHLSGNPAVSDLRASGAAVAGLLSRMHLYMENYEKSILYADRVIALNQYKMTDLNESPANSVFLKRSSREVIFTMGGNNMGSRMEMNMEVPASYHILVSGNLYNSFDAKDLRLQAFFKINSKGSIRSLKKGVGGNSQADDVSDKYSLRLSEMYLNKAEALAALERSGEAGAAIQPLLKCRFKPADIPQWQDSGADLMQKIREERRRELCFEGQRWFDLRRYGVNEKYPFGKSTTHKSVKFTGTGYITDGYYELGPYAQDEAAYTLPIADDEIEFNQGRITNEVRPVRALKQ